MENGFITEITDANTAEGANSFDGTGLYVSSGWIDMHVHAVAKLEPYGDAIDEIGVKQGVATIIDAGARRGYDWRTGGRGCKVQDECVCFSEYFAYRSARVDELSSLEWIDAEKATKAVNTYPDLIIGLKARISKSVVKDNGVEPLRLARKLSDKTSLPLMVHIGSGPPPIEEVLGRFRKTTLLLII